MTDHNSDFWKCYNHIANGQLDRAQTLLDAKPELVKETVSHDFVGSVSLLHLAAQLGNEKAVDMLVAAGADIAQGDSDNCTAAHYAAKYYHPKLIKKLVTENPDVLNQESGSWVTESLSFSTSNILGKAIEHDDGEMVKWLLNRGASEEIATDALFTAVGWYTPQSHPEMLTILLKERPEIVNNSLKFGAKPLHCAVTAGTPEVVDILLKAGADAAAIDSEGKTPLHYLLTSGARCSAAHNEEVANLLLTARPDTVLAKTFGARQAMDYFKNRHPADEEGLRPLLPVVEAFVDLQNYKYAALREMKTALDTATQQIDGHVPIDMAKLSAKMQAARELYRNQQGQLDSAAMTREYFLANPETDRPQLKNQWKLIKKAALDQLAQRVNSTSDREFLSVIGEYADFVDRDRDGKLDRPDQLIAAFKRQAAHAETTGAGNEPQLEDRLQAVQEAIEQFRNSGVSREDGASDNQVGTQLPSHHATLNAGRSK